MTEYVGSIFLTNYSAETIAEFMLLKDHEYNVVKCIPFYGMHEIYRRQMNNPIVIMPGMLMPENTFLGYIANVIIQTATDPKMLYTMTSTDIHLKLTKGMSARDIATLTGFELKKVQEFYKMYFVVDTH